MTTQPHVRELPLILAIEGHEATTTDFDTFISVNELSDDEAEELAMALLEEGEFHDGGGAAPRYVLRVA